MKILFKQISAGSGADIWAINLSKELQHQGVDSSTSFYSKNFQYFPHLLSYTDKKTDDSFIIHSNISYGFAFKGEGPLVVTEHHLVNDPLLSKYSSFQQKMFYKFVYLNEKKSLDMADKVTCVSKYTQQKLEEVFEYYDSKVIYNGINPDTFKPLPVNKQHYGIDEKKIVIFFAGNLSKRKGADLLPKIMKKLGDKYLLLLTSGLRNNQKISSDNIRLLGTLDNEELVKTYNLADIYLFPSRLEGFGFTVAEAMACEKPIVTTNCSSLPELVTDEKSGFLCEIDNVDDFVDKLLYLSENENLRKKMGEFNRKKVLREFTLQDMGKNYFNLYESF
jgi:glycosyltransferase involved in cell wall biosynthesis